MSHAANTSQPMKGSTLFISIDRTEFKETKWQVAVTAALRLEDKNVERAVHRLQVVILALLSNDSVFINFFVETHRRKHSVCVPLKVT